MHRDWRACWCCALRSMVRLELTTGWVHLLTPSKSACSCQSGAHGWCSHCLLFGCMRPCADRSNRDVRGISEEGLKLCPQGCAACVAVGARLCVALSQPCCVDGSREPSAAAPPPAYACLWSPRASDTHRGCPPPRTRGRAFFGGFTIVHTLKTPKRLPSLAGLGSCFLCCSPHAALLNHASRARSVPLSVGSPSAVLKLL